MSVVTPVAAGLYAWHRSPFERFGKLLVATGGGVLVASLSMSDDPVLYSVGRVMQWVVEGALIYLVLAFPSGRLTGRLDRELVAAAALLVAFLFIPTALLVDAYPTPPVWPTCASACPRNAFTVVPTEPALIREVVIPLRELLAIAVFAAVIGRLAQRILGATRLLRVTLTPVLTVAIARLFALILALATRRGWPRSPVVDVAQWLVVLAVPALAAAFLIGLLRWWAYVGASLRRLATRLRATLGPPELREALAVSFEDPTLELVYRQGDGWVDADGHTTLPPTADARRCVTKIADLDRVVAALIHDRALRHEQAFVGAAASHAVATLEHQRLTANAAALERELTASRERIAATVETERKRIERDLHDGAQQRLVAVSIRLESVTKILNDDPPRGKAVMRELGDDLERAIAEVRQLGRGAAPRALTRLGLARALELVAKQAPIPTAVEDASLGRYDGEIEAAAYFWCLEGLQNASKHAVGATRVRILVAERDHRLHLEVSDDGDGFDVEATTANGGFRNIRHRIAAVRGDMRVESGPGCGTRVSATIPL